MGEVIRNQNKVIAFSQDFIFKLLSSRVFEFKKAFGSGTRFCWSNIKKYFLDPHTQQFLIHNNPLLELIFAETLKKLWYVKVCRKRL